MKSLRVHLDGFNFPTSPAVDSTVKLLSVISVPAQPTAFWEIFEIYVKLIYKQTLCVVLLHSALLRFYCCMRECMQPHHQWTAMFLQFVVFWYLLVLSFVPFLFFFFNVITHLLNINATGKKRPGCKKGHRRHGSARDQIRRHGLLHHACGNRTLAVVPGARCQIITLRTSQEKGEFPLLCSGTQCTIKQQATVGRDWKVAWVDYQCQIMLIIVYQN